MAAGAPEQNAAAAPAEPAADNARSEETASVTANGRAADDGVDFAEAKLTCVCRKLYSHQFEAEQTPPEVQDWIYHGDFPPHTMFIGEVVDVIER